MIRVAWIPFAARSSWDSKQDPTCFYSVMFSIYTCTILGLRQEDPLNDTKSH